MGAVTLIFINKKDLPRFKGKKKDINTKMCILLIMN